MLGEQRSVDEKIDEKRNLRHILEHDNKMRRWHRWVTFLEQNKPKHVCHITSVPIIIPSILLNGGLNLLNHYENLHLNPVSHRIFNCDLVKLKPLQVLLQAPPLYQRKVGEEGNGLGCLQVSGHVDATVR